MLSGLAAAEGQPESREECIFIPYTKDIVERAVWGRTHVAQVLPVRSNKRFYMVAERLVQYRLLVQAT